MESCEKIREDMNTFIMDLIPYKAHSSDGAPPYLRVSRNTRQAALGV